MIPHCPTCNQPTDHLVSDDPTMYGCLTETCRVCTFFPEPAESVD